MVQTFEARVEGLRPVGTSASLAEASAALPAGAYTTFRTYGGQRVWRLDHHVRRLEESAAAGGRAAALDPVVFRHSLGAAVRAAGHPESRIRVTFAPPRLFVSLEPFAPLPEGDYRDGVRCVSLPLHRDKPHAKDTGFLATAHDAYRGLPPNVHEGLLLAQDGILLEGLSSNFFAVRDGALWTEEDRVLPGLTRALVLELAEPLLPRGPRGLRREELGLAREAFLTSASRGVLPVVEVDAVTVGDGRPGPVTADLRRRFDERVWREAESLTDP